jgi:hypothetical protein
MNPNTYTNWKSTATEIFWAEIAPCDHVLQIYENDSIFNDALAGFVGGGINAGECVVVIATKSHLDSLEKILLDFGISVPTLVKDYRYIPLDAAETLSKFMVNGWPDETLFNQTVSEILNSAGIRNRKVRAFGEMVALLWAEGNAGATVNLEHLWNKFCAQQSFTLFCAYPKSGFTQDMNESMINICGCHSKMIDGSRMAMKEVFYKAVV